MTNLKFLSLIFFLQYVLLAISLPVSHSRTSINDAKLVEQTCRQTPNYGLCIQYLKSDPRSSGADVSGLALIMVDAIKARANDAVTKIHQLLQGSHDRAEKEALNSCADKYKAVLEADVAEAIEALQKGDPKFAEDGANDAAVEASSCENGFSAGKSPLTHENNAVHDVSAVTAAIVRLLL